MVCCGMCQVYFEKVVKRNIEPSIPGSSCIKSELYIHALRYLQVTCGRRWRMIALTWIHWEPSATLPCVCLTVTWTPATCPRPPPALPPCSTPTSSWQGSTHPSAPWMPSPPSTWARRGAPNLSSCFNTLTTRPHITKKDAYIGKTMDKNNLPWRRSHFWHQIKGG